MILRRLVVDGFRNLKNFRMELTSGLTVLVGPNGSGKSNIFEALIRIFQALYEGARASFPFDLEYDRNGVLVRIQQFSPTTAPTFTLDGEPVSAEDFYVHNTGDEPPDTPPAEDPFEHFDDATQSALRRYQQKSPYLPARVFTYYSGQATRLHPLFWEHRWLHARLAESIDEPQLPPLFLARTVHSRVASLAFFSDLTGEARNVLRDEVGVEDIEAVLLVLRRPPSHQGPGAEWIREVPGAAGVLLDRLYKWALAPMQVPLTVARDFDHTDKGTFLHLFLPGDVFTSRLPRWYTGQLPDEESDKKKTPRLHRRAEAFFEDLEALEALGLVEDLRVFLKIRGQTIETRELSEGEQQLVTVLGMLLYTRNNESLFLLDEPDTHLNPLWTQRFFKIIQQTVGYDQTSHLVITTHDPLLVTGLDRHQVRVMFRDASGSLQLRIPEQDLVGRGVNRVLTSDVFGLSTALDLPTQEILDRKRHLAFKKQRGHPLDENEQRLLEAYNKILDRAGLTLHDRDPLFALFERLFVELGGHAEFSGINDIDHDELVKLGSRILEQIRKELL